MRIELDLNQTNEWINTWIFEHEKYPFQFEIGMSEPLNENDIIKVALIPDKARRDRKECYKDEKYKNGYEIPVFLFHEKLTFKTARALETQLITIKEFQGIELYESLAYMVQIFIMINDLIRSKKGMPSILSIWPTWGDAITTIPEDERNQIRLTKNPIWSINLLLDFWIGSGARLAKGIFENKLGNNFVIDYMLVPARWMPIESFEENEVEKIKQRKFTVTVDSFTKTILDYYPDGFKSAVEADIRKIFDMEKDLNRNLFNETPKYKIETFPHLPNLKWEEVTFEFVTEDSVRIRAKNRAKIFTYVQIGFLDRRKRNLWDSRWELLRDEFARFDGEIYFDTPIDSTWRQGLNLKYAIRDLRRKLKSIMRINEDPFYKYKEVKAYITKFRIKDCIPSHSKKNLQ